MAEVVGDAYVRIRPETSNFDAELTASMARSSAALENIAKNLGQRFENEANNKLAPAGKTVQNAWSGLTDMFSSKLGPAANAAQGELSKLGTSTISSMGGLATGVLGAVAVAGTAIAAFVGKGIADYENLAGSIRKFMTVSGETAQQASATVAWANAYGVSLDSLTRSSAFFNAQISLHPAILQKWDIQVARNADGSVSFAGSLENLRTRLHATTDASQKDAIAKQALGKSYQDILPILNASDQTLANITQEAQKRGLIFNQADINSAMEFKNQTRALHQSVQALSIHFGKEFVPVLTQAAAGLTRLVDGASQVASHFGGLGNVIKALAPGLGILADFGKGHESATAKAAAFNQAQTDVASTLKSETVAVDGSTKAAQQLAVAQHNLGDATVRISDAEDNLAKAHAELTKLMVKPLVDTKQLAADQLALARASQHTADAEDNLAKVQQRVNDVFANAGQYHKDLVDAETQVERSTTSLTDAQQRLEDIQQKVNDVMRDAGTFAKDQAHAQLAVEHAHLSQTQAAKQLTDAQLALQQAQQWGYAPDIAVAQLALEQAQLGVRDATQATGDAQDRLTAVNNQAIPGTNEYEALQKELRDATTAVGDAATAQMNAQDKLNSVQREAIPGTAEYRDLQHQLRDANNQVADAVDAQKAASDKYALTALGDINRSQELTDKRKAVRDAERQVTDAKWAAQQASIAVGNADEALARAREDAANATDAFTKAQDALNKVMGQTPKSGSGGGGGGGGGLSALGTLSPVKGLYDLGKSIGFWAEGGTVPGPTGAPQLAIVHGGEQITSVDDVRKGKGKGGGDTTIAPVINVHPSPGMDESTIAALTNAELAWQIRAAIR